MSDHPVFSEELREIVESFIVETREVFDELDNDLLELEHNAHDQALIDKIFRAVHTVKGTSGFLSLEQMSVLAHHFEDVLNRLRRGERALAPGMMDVLFAAFDQMKVLLHQVEEQHLVELDLSGLIAQLQAISDGTFGQENTSGDEPSEASPPAGTRRAPEVRSTGRVISDHPVFSEELREIVESFIVETREVFDELDNDLLELEHNAHDQALIDKIFRAVHTVKGTSGFLSLEQMSVLAHHFEDVLNRLRRGERALAPGMMDVLFAAFDQMKVLLHQVEEQHLVELDLSGLIAQLQAISNGTFGQDSTPAPAMNDRPTEAKPTAPPAATQPEAAPAAGERRTTRSSTETIRVEVRRLDNLMDLVGELVLGRNRLLQLVSDLDETEEYLELLRELVETSSQLDFITTELQTAVMHTRMVQIGRVFNKFPRVVRDLAREFHKEIDLVIEGQETEVDKSLIEEISDPLVHLIRNASDHGIETPEERRSKGKPVRGTIRLTAAHEGNHIVIRVEDDGAGIDPEKIKQHAIKKGLITPKEAAEMKDQNAFELIFTPGFSTAKQVSQVSGRGVGMDVVKTNIARLNGTIHIDSTLGRGTCFTLKLPLTLAIIQSLLVRLNEETFAIPLHAVIEVVGLREGDVQTIRGREVIRLREQVLPLVRIGDTLGVPGAHRHARRSYAVIVGIAHHRLGLIVDDLVGQKEIVIKPLGTFLKKTRGIAGSTILGDGRVIMILDVAEIVRIENARRRDGAEQREAA
ncbi:chemotaxis protein CheA [Rhodocaloribacter litoris]|uniref:chemotaxis protein CheA n=1 Tax=Rhodocaloribacter litoris TaxID=2558931 RepID=UPI00142240D6|nr:chemotaxis protein CheA [Rhodocaloribacter litoris]QXD16055.1 chemotaxis protein CheA [Rhodocaloribacter litoris]